MRRRSTLMALGALLTGCGPIGTILRRNITALGVEPRAVPHAHRDPRREDVPLAVTWIGHATALVQMGSRFVLTDPVFSETVGQFSPRLVEPGRSLDALPPLDMVVLSHSHIDHLDFRSLDDLRGKMRDLAAPRGGLIYVPRLRGVRVRAVRPWHTLERGPLRVTAVPVDHQGYRYGVDADWIEGGYTGWVFECAGLTVYFGGDTAYDPHLFRQTRARFPKIDLALLPIAPIEPRDPARETHLDGAEAVQAFVDLGAAHMVPIHFDTFPHGADRLGDAARRLTAAARRAGVMDRVHILDVGEQWPPPPAWRRRLDLAAMHRYAPTTMDQGQEHVRGRQDASRAAATPVRRVLQAGKAASPTRRRARSSGSDFLASRSPQPRAQWIVKEPCEQSRTNHEDGRQRRGSGFGRDLESRYPPSLRRQPPHGGARSLPDRLCGVARIR